VGIQACQFVLDQKQRFSFSGLGPFFSDNDFMLDVAPSFSRRFPEHSDIFQCVLDVFERSLFHHGEISIPACCDAQFVDTS
jgi:hypothetical protein